MNLWAFKSYAVAAAAILLGWLVQWILGPEYGEVFAFAPFLVAVMATAWVAGLGPTLFAMAAGYFVVAVFYLSPGTLMVRGKDNLTALLIYILLGLSSGLLAELLHRARRRAEATSERLRVTLFSIGDAVIVTDADGRITALNPVAESLTGWQGPDAVAQPHGAVLKILHEDTRQPVESPVSRVLRGDPRTSLAGPSLLVTKQGAERPVDVTAAPIRDEPGAIAGVVLVLRDVTERRQHVRAIEESEQRFRQLAENIRNVFWMSDPQKNEVLYVSQSYEEIWGRTCDSLYEHPRSFFDCVHPDDQKRVSAESLERQSRGEATEVDYRVVRPDGSVRWVNDRSFPIRDSAGRFYRLVGFAEDITARRQAEDALRESEERLRLALDAGSLGVWDWDIVHNQLNWSERVYEIHGVDRATFPGRVEDFTRLLHPDDADRISHAIEETMAGTAPYHVEFRIIRPSGETRWVYSSGRVVRDEAGRPVRMLGATIDTTERKKAEETLRFLSEAGATVAALVDVRSTMQTVARLAVPFFADCCLVDLVNENGQIERLAYAHADPAKEQLLKELVERYPVDWNSASIAVRVLRSGKPEYIGEVPAQLLDSLATSEDHRRLLELINSTSLIVVPLLSRSHAIGAIGFSYSNSGRRYRESDVGIAEELARRAATAVENARLYQGLKEAHRQKDDFLAMLAHELRNPLAAIEYAIQLSRVSAGQAPAAAEIIERQVRHLAHLIDDLLDVSRITRDRIQLQKEQVDARLIVRRAVATAQPAIEKAHHRLAVEVADAPLPIFADPTRVEQILVNLLTNAAKYTPDGGDIALRAAAENEQLVIKVKDSGIGIPAEMLSNVFELFTQVNPTLERSQGGLGIGLTVVRRLAEMHGGSVSATSEGLSRGSEFTVRLPLADGERQDAEPVETEINVAPGLRVLIVEDNADTADSMSLLLRDVGCVTRIVRDGASAVQAAVDFRPAVVILDIGLPGLDGYGVAQRLRAVPEFGDVRLIAVSGYGQEQDRRRAGQAGFDHHLVKPVKFEAILPLLMEGRATPHSTKRGSDVKHGSDA